MGRIGVFMSVIGENTRLQLAVLLRPPVIPPALSIMGGAYRKRAGFLAGKGLCNITTF